MSLIVTFGEAIFLLYEAKNICIAGLRKYFLTKHNGKRVRRKVSLKGVQVLMMNPFKNKIFDLARWLNQAGLAYTYQKFVVLAIFIVRSRGWAACCDRLITLFEEINLENTTFA
jgi:hypothetical protein